jgi:hypothetical protein
MLPWSPRTNERFNQLLRAIKPEFNILTIAAPGSRPFIQLKLDLIITNVAAALVTTLD